MRFGSYIYCSLKQGVELCGYRAPRLHGGGGGFESLSAHTLQASVLVITGIFERAIPGRVKSVAVFIRRATSIFDPAQFATSILHCCTSPHIFLPHPPKPPMEMC